MKQEISLVRAGILQALGPNRCQWIRDGQLEIDDRGTIVYCGRGRTTRGKNYKKIAVPTGAVIIPGLVDCHSHLSQYHVRGRTGHTLMAWLGQYVYPAEQRFASRSYARDISQKYFEKLLSNGVTCVAAYANFPQGVEEGMTAAIRCGIRAVMGYTLMDRNVPQALRQRPERALTECRRLNETAKRRGQGRVQFAVNPRFAPATSGRFMEMVGKFAREEGLYIQTHLSENTGEVEIVKKLFPGITSYAGVYDRFGLLTPKTLLAHCIHLSPAERRLIVKRGCAVVHCPSSNLFLHSGRFPMEHWRDYPKLCLGTDVGAGPSFSMLDTARDAYFVNQAGQASLFYWATMGGATALGLGERIGSMKSGKQADFSVITFEEGRTKNRDSILADLIFKWDQVRFRQVFVGGREIWASA